MRHWQKRKEKENPRKKEIKLNAKKHCPILFFFSHLSSMKELLILSMQWLTVGVRDNLSVHSNLKYFNDFTHFISFPLIYTWIFS
jgi:hypothetical protein